MARYRGVRPCVIVAALDQRVTDPQRQVVRFVIQFHACLARERDGAIRRVGPMHVGMSASLSGLGAGSQFAKGGLSVESIQDVRVFGQNSTRRNVPTIGGGCRTKWPGQVSVRPSRSARSLRSIPKFVSLILGLLGRSRNCVATVSPTMTALPFSTWPVTTRRNCRAIGRLLFLFNRLRTVRIRCQQGRTSRPRQERRSWRRQ